MKRFIQKNKDKIWKFVRFGLVGGIATAIHYGVYCLVLLGFGHATISYTVGYAVAFVFNYYLTTYFTFQSKPNTKNALGFGVSHLVNYLLEIGLLNLFLLMGISEFLAPILVLVVVIPINFLMLYFFFSKKSNAQIG